jgi:hypothetical protein
MLYVLLDDHAAHAEVYSNNLAWVVGDTGVLY